MINGTTDVQVGPESARKLAAANSRSKLVIINDMNHVLRLCKTDAEQLQTYRDSKAPLHTELVPGIVPGIVSSIAKVDASQK